MSHPQHESADVEVKKPGYTCFSYDSDTGETTVTHLAEPPTTWVVHDDGTRMLLEEYMANERLAGRDMPSLDCDRPVIVPRPEGE